MYLFNKYVYPLYWPETVRYFKNINSFDSYKETMR